MSVEVVSVVPYPIADVQPEEELFSCSSSDTTCSYDSGCCPCGFKECDDYQLAMMDDWNTAVEENEVLEAQNHHFRTRIENELHVLVEENAALTAENLSLKARLESLTTRLENEMQGSELQYMQLVEEHQIEKSKLQSDIRKHRTMFLHAERLASNFDHILNDLNNSEQHIGEKRFRQ